MIPEFSKVSVGDAAGWFSEGWKLMKTGFFRWIVMVLLASFFLMAISFIPFLGPLAAALLSPVLGAGLLIAADKSARSEIITIGEAFRVLQNNVLVKRLLVIGALGMLVNLLIMAIGGASLGSGIPGDIGSTASSGISFLWISVLSQSLWGAAILFGIPLVTFAGVDPPSALLTSLKAVITNWWPMLVFTIITVILGFLAMIPFGLGLLIYFPLMITTSYRAYHGVFGQKADSSYLEVQSRSF